MLFDLPYIKKTSIPKCMQVSISLSGNRRRHFVWRKLFDRQNTPNSGKSFKMLLKSISYQEHFVITLDIINNRPKEKIKMSWSYSPISLFIIRHIYELFFISSKYEICNLDKRTVRNSVKHNTLKYQLIARVKIFPRRN